MNDKLIILGSKGMLGQMVKKYFEREKFDIVCYDQRFSLENRSPYSDFLNSLRSGYVINCIGKIRQKTNDVVDLLPANSILPAELRNVLHKDVVLIHPSTDCVFNGKFGSPYSTDHPADAEDDYGWTKRLGEVVLDGRPNTLVLRVSIIGPDNNPRGKGLMAWVRSNPPCSSVKGFTNHLWNGITTLEWCKQVKNFLSENSAFEFKLVQYGTREFYSKYEMLLMLNQMYELHLQIEPTETETSVDRRLVPDTVCKSLNQQLEELKAFENG